MAAWFDRQASQREFLSVRLDAFYLVHYFTGLTHAPKVGTAALLAVIAQGLAAFSTAFFAVTMLWVADMVLGTMRALRDPEISFRWSKLGDGLLRLVVILVVPPVLSIAELMPQAAGLDLNQSLATFALGIMGVQEFLSVIENAEFFYPRFRTWRQSLVRRTGSTEAHP